MASAYERSLRIFVDDVDGLRLTHTRHDCGSVYLDSYTNTIPVDFEVKLDTVVALARIVDGGLDIDDGHHAFSVGRGEVFAATTHRPYRSITNRPTATLVGVESSLLADLAGDDGASIQRLEHHLVDPARARAWNATVTHVTDYLTSPLRAAADQPGTSLLIDSTNRILAAAMLTTLLPDPEPAPSDRTDAHPQTIRQAVSFIEANPDIALTVVDIARAAHVTPTALRLGFRRHLDTTPTAYLRRVRLDQAHDDLLQSDLADGITVATVAGRWGFGNLDRFDRHYRHTFGEPPDFTLQR